MILLTGATGFVGGHLLEELRKRPEVVRCLVHRSRSPELLRGENVEAVQGSVLDRSSLNGPMRGVDTVIHLVAVIREKGPATFQSVNHLGTRNVVQAAREAGVVRFIHMSANGARNDPHFPYLLSKWQGEEEVRGSGLPYAILRPSIIFGEGDEFITVLADLIKKLPVVPIIGRGTTRLQPIWVHDVVRCLVAILDRGDSFLGRETTVGGPQQLTYEQIVDTIISVLDVKRWRVHVPLSIMKPLVRLGERVLPYPPITSAELGMLELDNIAAPDAVKEQFGFDPLPLREGIDYVR
ncbi:MAG: NAD-dependent epimerase/dehydratase family protein [Chloroflexota bacterium]|nr:MAG: NAD-dependent epimerase/dehydratase family protein [Chloroflexota bacterium]